MQTLKIIQHPDPILSAVCKPVTDFDVAQELVWSMRWTVLGLEKPALGLAAPQVGSDLRIFIADIGGKWREFVNPKIVESDIFSGVISTESCLSCGDLVVDMVRCKDIVVEYQDMYGNENIEELTGMDAIVFQHELDHLNGICIGG
jgi:peptide deformylase